MVWFDLKVGSWKLKYTPLAIPENEFQDCDEKGNILKRVSGKFERGHFVNEKTGETLDKSFKLINGKATAEFKGRVKEVEKFVEIPRDEAEDVIIEKEFLVESDELYNTLSEKGKAIKFGGWYGTGYKAYKCYLTPSRLFKGFLIMSCGRGQKTDVIKDIVGELNDIKSKKQKLAEIEATIQRVDRAKVEDLIEV